MLKRYHIIFSGRVQGVGFRYTARYLAGKYNLVGWVMNLANGDVELEIEGKAPDISKFLTELHQEFKGYIRDEKIEEFTELKNYKDFQIRFY